MLKAVIIIIIIITIIIVIKEIIIIFICIAHNIHAIECYMHGALK